jgi:hypothetical protein
LVATRFFADGDLSVVKRKHVSTEVGPAWPVVIYWLLSIAQYSFRYILKVNDTHTSGFGYSDTPWYLSGIKHVITAGFIAYCIVCKIRNRGNRAPQFGVLNSIYLVSLAVGLVILGIKLAGRDGTSYEILQAWLQTWPYLILPLLLPACMRTTQIVPTLKTFSEWGLLITALFWGATVYLYQVEGRYPALSWPGQVRFGGILDDPNGYAALMALIIALTIAFKGRLWVCRLVVCIVMCVMTRSLAGLVVVVVTLAVMLIQRASQMKGFSISAALLTTGLLIGALIALCLPDVQDGLNTFAAEVKETLLFKHKSIELHVTDLVSPPDLGVDADLLDWLVGRAGIPENFYYWTLTNFGVMGSFFVGGSLIASMAALANRGTRAGPYIFAWGIGIIIGSAGIPYLRNFPINMLFWSAISVVTQQSSVSASRWINHRTSSDELATAHFPSLLPVPRTQRF